MSRFQCHTETMADFGMIPKPHAVMAKVPTVLDAYQQLHQTKPLKQLLDKPFEKFA